VELRGESVDWEVELVVVIGIGGRDIPTDAAWSHIAGLTLGQDISDRVVQKAGNPPQFSLGKSFDTYGPIGPAVVSVDAFDDPNDIGLWCEISGQRMQDGRSSDLIFDVATLVSYLSAICTLRSGDLIFTGTPSGVGASQGRFLTDGDVIQSGAEVIGTLTNRCRHSGSRIGQS
jgi:2-keto-4-pentenoate hydratase/2-oxohepta-3-ene-1,7-dioic acid hydratase in catechol pathway